LALVHEPQQQRSRDTRDRILAALERLLESHFFEQITTRQLAREAGVSPATLYRRFQDKNALLPALYERYDKQLSRWGRALWDEDQRRQHTSVKERVTHVVKEHVNFYRDNAPILRTVYLHARLHPDIELGESAGGRQAGYMEILAPIFEALHQQGHERPDEGRIKLFCLILITSVNERALFSTTTPARILELSDGEFVRELSRNLVGYLVRESEMSRGGT
jgi:AcrR family transcriptional regulator